MNDEPLPSPSRRNNQAFPDITPEYHGPAHAARLSKKAQDTRKDDCIFEAGSDAEAVSRWLKAKAGGSKHTFYAYQRVANRLLVWLSELHIDLSCLTLDLAEDYLRHLQNPPEHWLRTKDDDPLLPTQLLDKGMSPSSLKYERTILAQMMRFLVEAGWLQRNAFRFTGIPKVTKSAMLTRFLDHESWTYLWLWLEKFSLQDNVHGARARWLFALLYFSGMRREEVAKAVMGDFWRKNGWKLRVLGKGGVNERMVTVNDGLLSELKRYREIQGLPPLPSRGDTTPVIAPFRQRGEKDKTLSPRAIASIIEEVVRRAAIDCPDPQIADAIAKTTTHWMRHTSATHRYSRGAALLSIKAELGHKSISSTEIYTKAMDKQLIADAEKLTLPK